MRIISMVPSWTETLLCAGVNVVGRTRFCIHPAEKIKDITVVGGTKNINWDKVNELKAELIILDQEENLKAMADESPIPYFSTHVQTCSDVSSELFKLSEKVRSKELSGFAKRWEKVLLDLKKSKSDSMLQLHKLNDLQQKNLGLLFWINKPTADYRDVVYLIWKKPWMAITDETFIGSVLSNLNLPTSLSSTRFSTKYPEVNLSDFDRDKTLFLFSSEPYPFSKKYDDLQKLNLKSGVVDGECFSWFGLRALQFLENQLK